MKWRVCLALAVGALIVASFLVPNAPMFPKPELARMIFFHLPCALLTVPYLFGAAYFSFRYLRTREAIWDIRSAAAHESAGVLSILTMATGILFSKAQWGDWWSWDPRQTSFLIVLLILGAYFALRAAFEDSDRRATNSAAYALASLLPNLFLIFVFPRMPNRFSLHPSNTIVSGGFDTPYRTVLLGLIVTLGFFTYWTYRQRIRLGVLENQLEETNGQLDTRNDSAPIGVVRPVRLPHESGETD